MTQMAIELVECLHCVQKDGVFRTDYTKLVEDTMKSAMGLAADVKCQRGVYEIDDSVHLGDSYDDTKMVNVRFSDDDEEDSEAFVKAILSNGWVRRPYSGSKDIEARICKARVVVGYTSRP